MRQCALHQIILISQQRSNPSANLPVGALEPTVYSDSARPSGLDTPQSGATSETPQSGQVVAPTVAVVSPPLEPTMSVQQEPKRLSRMSAALLIGSVVLIIAGGVLGSVSLLAHFGVISTGNSVTRASPVRGGTWVDDVYLGPDSFIPNGSSTSFAASVDQALYLPLFYGDAQGWYILVLPL